MQAKWLVCIDWNDDGDFSDPSEDVTPDVLGLTLEHFRDLASEYMESARLDLELRNDTHRYSPPNTASPLYGRLAPGRRVWVRAAYPFDSLSGEPGARLDSRIPNLGAGFAWTEHGGVFEIAPSGAGVRTTGSQSGPRVATIDFGSPDISFGCWFTRIGSSSQGGLCLRRSVDGYLHVRVTGAAIEVREARAGSSDTLIASTPHTWDDGAEKFLQVAMHADDIHVFVDDLAVLEAVSSFNTSATNHGLLCEGEADHLWRGFGGWVSLFHGRVDAIQPRPRRGAQYCYLRAFDEMERLGTVTLYTYATAQLPQSTGDILDHILDYARVDPVRRKIDDGAALVPDTFSPAIWGVTAVDEIHRLQDEEDGLVYVDGHGRWRLEARDHRDSGSHVSTLATVTDSGGGTGPYFSDLVWDDGAGNVENMVFMRIRGYTNHGLRTAWTLAEKPAFRAFEAKDFLAEGAGYDTLGGQLTPIPNLDYRANTAQDGSGDNLTAQVAVSYPDTATYNGKGTLIRVTFGAAPGYLTLLQLRTLNAITYDDPVILLADDANSRLGYGDRIRSIDARWTRESDTALAAIQSRLDRRKDPRTVLRLTVKNGSGANLMLVLQRAVSDRLRVSYPDMGIDRAFFVEGRSITVSEGWTLVTGTLLLRVA